MKSRVVGTLLATCLLTLSPQDSVAQTTLYGGIGRGGGPNSGWLITIDQGTGAGTLVGLPDSVSGLTGLAFDISGALYGTTRGGGPCQGCGLGYGTVYKLTPPASGAPPGTLWTEAVVYFFAGASDGSDP